MTEHRRSDAGEVPAWGIIAGSLLALVVLVAAAGVGMAAIWHDDLLAADRLLPGSEIAGVDLGLATTAEARAVAEEAGREALARSITLAHGEERWVLTPADVGGFADVDTALGAVTRTTWDASPFRAALARVAGVGGKSVPVRLSFDEAVLAQRIDAIAESIDRQPRDATLTWAAEGVEVAAHEDGRLVDRDAAMAAARDALLGTGEEHVQLQVEQAAPAVLTAMVEPARQIVAAAVEASLDRPVVIADGEREWTVSARELGAVPDLQPLLDEALTVLPAPAPQPTPASSEPVAVQAADISPSASGDAAQAEPPPDTAEVVLAARPILDLGQDEVDAFVGRVADEIDVPVRDAGLNLDGGWVELVREQDGRIVDRVAAATALRDALADGADRVELPTTSASPEVTADAFSHVLLVRQDQRKLYLFRDGEVVREWPVAIGAAGHATPTGTFTVGAKRHSPTWINPSPNGWGADMPAQIGPGPDNPLGLRALNWDRPDGGQTLIRFHGTSNLSSIGSAASKGCIRLRNPDVVELYDLVPTGATIVSTWG